jgi:hypothetical protein
MQTSNGSFGSFNPNFLEQNMQEPQARNLKQGLKREMGEGTKK